MWSSYKVIGLSIHHLNSVNSCLQLELIKTSEAVQPKTHLVNLNQNPIILDQFIEIITNNKELLIDLELSNEPSRLSLDHIRAYSQQDNQYIKLSDFQGKRSHVQVKSYYKKSIVKEKQSKRSTNEVETLKKIINDKNAKIVSLSKQLKEEKDAKEEKEKRIRELNSDILQMNITYEAVKKSVSELANLRIVHSQAMKEAEIKQNDLKQTLQILKRDLKRKDERINFYQYGYFNYGSSIKSTIKQSNYHESQSDKKSRKIKELYCQISFLKAGGANRSFNTRNG